MPDLEQLRKHYDQVLKDVWEEWEETLEAQHIPGEGISPFLDMADIPSLDENAGFNWSVGWLTGVSNALGWSRERPLGPKEWSPQGRHPRRPS